MSAVDVAQALWLLLAALGLNLAVGHAGMPVLGQGAFVAAGGYGTVLLADRGDLPLGVAAATATATSAALGWLVAHGAARLRGAHLALATWALAWFVHAVLSAFPGTFGGSQGLVRGAPARLVSRWLGVELVLTPVWHVVTAGALCAVVAVVTRSVARGPVGLDLAALREGPAVAAAVGVPVPSLRRGALAASAGVGALSGAGTAVLLGLVAPGDVSPLLSVQLYAAVLVGGTATVLGPVAGVALLVALPHAADALASSAGTGVERSRGLLTAALLLAALVTRTALERRPTGSPRRGPDEQPDEEPDEPEPASSPAAAPVLVARGLQVRYGALAALDGVDLDVRPGEVHALIGPNGSGKTTALRVLAGALRADAGSVVVDGRDVTALDQRGRVLAGVARTFQTTAVLPGRTAAEDVRTGARVTEHGGVAWRPLLRTPRARIAGRDADRRARRLMRAAALAHVATVPAASLDHGAQRRLQVARAAATGARVLLLDEPAAGMSADEARRLAAFLRDLVGNGAGVLLVEHDMRLVTALADRVTVLAAGRVLASGTPEEVRRDPQVRAAYLGEVA